MELEPQQSTRTILIWWLIVVGLVLWNIIALWPRSLPEVTIPYTTFLAQVRADNIARVHISGDEISGVFVKPIQWPLPVSGVTSPKTIALPNTSPTSSSPDASSTSPSSTSTPTPSKTSSTAKSSPAPASSSPPATYSEFFTIFPQTVGDPNLLSLLETHKVIVEVAPPPSHWLEFLLISGLPTVLLVVLFLWMGRRVSQGQHNIFGFGRSKARRYTSDHPEVTFADVAGANEAKTELQEEVSFLRHPKKYHDLGARIPRGVLLVGPPSSGKTLLARAVAGEANVPFFSISASEFVEMFVGVGASRV